MGIKYSQNEQKSNHCGVFPSQGSTHRVDSCTGVDSWGRLNWVCQLKITCHSAPFAMSRLKYINMIFFQNTHLKILKLTLIDYKSCVLAFEASESKLDKIMILPLKYNKFFFKPKSLVTPSYTL